MIYQYIIVSTLKREKGIPYKDVPCRVYIVLIYLNGTIPGMGKSSQTRLQYKLACARCTAIQAENQISHSPSQAKPYWEEGRKERKNHG